MIYIISTANDVHQGPLPEDNIFSLHNHSLITE